jgi:hypothetical protein
MFKKDNDYSIEAFDNNGRRFFVLPFSHNIYKSSLWIKQKIGNYHHINVYNRRTRAFIIQFKEGDFIPPYPR